MDYVIDFLYVENADAITIWARENDADIVIFLDGGKSGDGKKVIDHFEKFIEPHLQKKHLLMFINSHPHNDHIKGLFEIIEYFGNRIKFGVYNDPVKFVTEAKRIKVYELYTKKADPDIVHLYETFEDVQRLNNLCFKYDIKTIDAFSDNNAKFSNYFKILSPSKGFYLKMLETFTNLEHLFEVDYSKKNVADVNELDEDNKPCTIVDEVNDAAPENLTSAIIELLDSNGKSYMLTGDAGVDSFNSAEENGFNLKDKHFVQLPHHGSRRNVNTNWLCKFNANTFLASARGSLKHPRRAVINCIKRNLPNSKIYSTHIGKGTLSQNTNKSKFPDRMWGSATPL